MYGLQQQWGAKVKRNRSNMEADFVLRCMAKYSLCTCSMQGQYTRAKIWGKQKEERSSLPSYLLTEFLHYIYYYILFIILHSFHKRRYAAAAAAKSLQSCPTL